jgi:hypothetical protein
VIVRTFPKAPRAVYKRGGKGARGLIPGRRSAFPQRSWDSARRSEHRVGATLRELASLAWSGCLIPTQRIIASQVGHKLLPEFEGSPERFAVALDTSKVSALLEDETARTGRWNSQVRRRR